MQPKRWFEADIGVASLGGTIEYYDYIIFVFFTNVIAQLFFPQTQALWLRQVGSFGFFAAGYVARPVGGLVIAHFGDVLGRKRMFVLSLFLMALPTAAIGLIPTYASGGPIAPIMLLACRLAQGAAIGGEGPGAWVFVHEHAQPGRRGIACGLLTSGLCCGIFVGSVVAASIDAVFTNAEVLSYAWRLPFLGGGLLGIASVAMRRRMAETPIFKAMSVDAGNRCELPVREVLRRSPSSVLLAMAATWQVTVALLVLVLMAPTLTFKGSAAGTTPMFIACMVSSLALTLSCVALGAAIDRFGARRVMLVSGLAVILTAYALYGGAVAGVGPYELVALHAISGGAVGMIVVTPLTIVRAFPTEIRFSGTSLSYNTASAVAGGLTPPLVAYLARHAPLAPAHYVTTMTLVGICALSALEAKRGEDDAKTSRIDLSLPRPT